MHPGSPAQLTPDSMCLDDINTTALLPQQKSLQGSPSVCFRPPPERCMLVGFQGHIQQLDRMTRTEYSYHPVQASAPVAMTTPLRGASPSSAHPGGTIFCGANGPTRDS